MHLLLIILLVPYFLPTIIAILRKKRNAGAVAVLNLLLGWTVIGWIVALVWALTADSPTVPVVNVTAYPPPSQPASGFPGSPAPPPAAFCQTCGARLSADARFCPSCGRSIPS